MMVKRFEFGELEILDILWDYLVSKGIYDPESAREVEWSTNKDLSITAEWMETPICEVCGMPLSAEECEMRERLEVFWEWLMSDDFYDDVEDE